MLTVAAVQLALAVGEVGANRAAGLAAITEAAAAGARLVVLPELSDTGYVFSDRDEAVGLADAGATLGGWVQAAVETGAVIVGGFCQREGDLLYNAAAVVDSGGVRAVYHKAHLWDREKEIFAAGDGPPPVVDTAAGRIGVMICYDLEFPEWVRLAAEAGAEIVAAPVNWPWADRPAAERPLEVFKAQAAAATYGVHVVVADRAGPERGVAWIGGSLVTDARGYPLAGPVLADRATTLLASLDPARARDKRINGHNDLFADRRPDLYHRLPGSPTSGSTVRAVR